MAANFDKVQRPAYYQSIPIMLSIHMYINRNRKEVYFNVRLLLYQFYSIYSFIVNFVIIWS